MTTRLMIFQQGLRIGSLILDDGKLRIIAAPTSTEAELWQALAAVVGAVTGKEPYVGSFQLADDALVFHVFDGGESAAHP